MSLEKPALTEQDVSWESLSANDILSKLDTNFNGLTDEDAQTFREPPKEAPEGAG